MANLFPSHDTNPAEKDTEWVLQYIKAAWDEYTKSNIKMFYNHRLRYAEIKDYVLCRQSVDKYKKAVAFDESSDESWQNIDWSVRAVAAKLRDIGLSKLIQKGYNITATPIDISARDETEQYFNKNKARLKLQEAAAKVNPSIAALPAFTPGDDEPRNFDELKMQRKFGKPLRVAMEAEEGIDMVLYQNGFKDLRKSNLESQWDYGPGGYKEYIDENNEVKVRGIDIATLVVSNCKMADFSDAKYIGEVTDVMVCDLPFDADTRKKIAESARGASQVWSSQVSGYAWDSGKVPVLDIEFRSTNDRVYEQRANKDGNVVYRRSDYTNKSKVTMTTIEGKEVPKYSNKPVEVVYRGKWVIGTDYIFDEGLAPNLKRNKANKALTDMSFHLYAYNFHRMMCLAMMERLIPIIDEYHTTVYKVQNFKLKWVPYIINLDIQAMENVALGDSGKPMEPKEILNLVFSNFVAMGRRMDVSGQLQNYKMVEIEPTGMHQEYTVLVNDLARLLNDMRDFVGLNDLTDGSTPGERTLNYVASLGNEATNNALYPITFADKHLTENLSKGVLLRLVITVKNGPVEGITRTLGDDTVKFIRVTPDIAERVWDVKLEDKPTDAQKEALIAQMVGKDQQGLLSPDDIIMISETNNLKAARVQLADSLNKKANENKQYELQKMQMNGQVQIQSAQATEQAKQQTLALEYKLKTELEMKKMENEKELMAMKLDAAQKQTETTASTKLMTQHMAGEDKPDNVAA